MHNRSKLLTIIGAGPTGLAALSSLFYLNDMLEPNERKAFGLNPIKVDLFEKRNMDDFNRRQKLISKPDINNEMSWIDFFNNLLEGLKNKYGSQLYNPLLNEFNSFITKLSNQKGSDTTNFSIKELQDALLSYIHFMESVTTNVQLNLRNQTEVTDIDFLENAICFTQDGVEQSIPFDAITVCDGANREITNLINSKLRELNEKEFSFKSFHYQPPTYNCGVRLKLRLTADDTCQNTSDLFAKYFRNTQENLPAFKALGWEKDTYPIFVFDSNFYKTLSPTSTNFDLRMFIASEIPKSIYDISNVNLRREKIIEWAKNIASHKTGIPIENFEFDTTGDPNLNATAFTATIDYVDNPFRVLEYNETTMVIALAGDNTIKPYYQLGGSSANGLNQAFYSMQGILFNDYQNFLKRYFADRDAMRAILKMNAKPTSFLPAITFKFNKDDACPNNKAEPSQQSLTP